MKRESLSDRIATAIRAAGKPQHPGALALLLGISVEAARTTLYRGEGRQFMRAEGGTWGLSNVVPIRADAPPPNRMLPVIRRDDCVHEPACSLAATKRSIDGEWKRDAHGRTVEGLTCPWACEDYRKAPRRPVPHPSNWMGGE